VVWGSLALWAWIEGDAQFGFGLGRRMRSADYGASVCDSRSAPASADWNANVRWWFRGARLTDRHTFILLAGGLFSRVAGHDSLGLATSGEHAGGGGSWMDYRVSCIVYQLPGWGGTEVIDSIVVLKDGSLWAIKHPVPLRSSPPRSLACSMSVVVGSQSTRSCSFAPVKPRLDFRSK